MYVETVLRPELGGLIVHEDGLNVCELVHQSTGSTDS